MTTNQYIIMNFNEYSEKEQIIMSVQSMWSLSVCNIREEFLEVCLLSQKLKAKCYSVNPLQVALNTPGKGSSQRNVPDSKETSVLKELQEGYHVRAVVYTRKCAMHFRELCQSKLFGTNAKSAGGKASKLYTGKW